MTSAHIYKKGAVISVGVELFNLLDRSFCVKRQREVGDESTRCGANMVLSAGTLRTSTGGESVVSGRVSG